MKGHNFRKFCLFHFFTLFQGQVMTCYYQVFDAHSMLVLHLEILYVEKITIFLKKEISRQQKNIFPSGNTAICSLPGKQDSPSFGPSARVIYTQACSS